MESPGGGGDRCRAGRVPTAYLCARGAPAARAHRPHGHRCVPKMRGRPAQHLDEFVCVMRARSRGMSIRHANRRLGDEQRRQPGGERSPVAGPAHARLLRRAIGSDAGAREVARPASGRGGTLARTAARPPRPWSLAGGSGAARRVCGGRAAGGLARLSLLRCPRRRCGCASAMRHPPDGRRRALRGAYEARPNRSLPLAQPCAA